MRGAAQLLALVLLSSPCVGQTGSVQGTVFSSIGRQLVRKARVTITTVAPDQSYAIAITDSAGQFHFAGIPQGSYRISASHTGFVSVPYGSSSPGRPVHLLELAKGQTRTGVVLTLAPVSTISGKVFDPDGDGIPFVQIALFTKQWRNGSVQFVHVSNRQTDQNGRYTANNLTAGQYWMAALPTFVRATPMMSVVTAGVIPPEHVFTTRYYPGVEHFVNAAPITVAPGQDLTGADYHLSYAPQTHLIGSITGVPDGTTAISAALLSEIPGDLAASVSAPIRTQSRSFEFRGAPGAYRLWVQAGKRRTVREIQLNGDENRVEVELSPGVPASGTVTGVDPNASQYKNIRIALSPADGLPMANIVATPVNGAFDLGEIPVGKWHVEVGGLPAGTYLKSMRFGEQDIYGKPLVLQSDSKGSLEVVLMADAPKVTGTVEPAGPATIVAALRGELAGRTTLYRAMQTNETGSFSFDHLAPGTYAFCALVDPVSNAWQDPEFLPKIEAACKSVELKEGAAETLQLTRIGLPQ